MQYQSVTIENFRGIQKLELTDLKKVNLLVGKNNCGKTSVLEAVFLLSGMSNPQLSVNIHTFRDLVLMGDDEFSFMFRDLDFATPISLQGILDNKKRSLTISPLYTGYALRKTNKQTGQQLDTTSSSTAAVRIVEGLDLKFQSESRQFNGRISLKEKEVSLKGKQEYKEKLHCSFMSPQTAMLQIDKRMEGLLVQKKLDNVLSILRGIEPNILDIRMGAGGMIYVDIRRERLLPINIMGDGMRRILAIIAAIADMKNGVLLVDEIENGLHYTSLSLAWKAILASCQEYNVQMIATTHSYECIEALSNTYAEIEPNGDNIRLYRIDQGDSKHQVFPFNTEVLRAGIEKAFEVR